MILVKNTVVKILLVKVEFEFPLPRRGAARTAKRNGIGGGAAFECDAARHGAGRNS